MMDNSKVVRQSGIELLRIISMLLILFHHGVVHSHLNFLGGVTFNKVFLSSFIFGGKFGVDIFVLISGYFLCKQQYKVEKVIKLLSQLIFYVLLILSIAFTFFFNQVTWEKTILSLYPFQGFAINYLFLYLLSPFINKFIYSLEKQEYTKLLVILTIILSILPTFLPPFDGFYLLSWLVHLYLLGAYIRINENKVWIKKYKNKLLVFSLIVIFLTTMFSGLNYLIIKKTFLSHYLFWVNEYTLYRDNSFLLLIGALLLFLWGLAIDIGENKVINFVASGTFGVLLLHDNPYREIWFTNIFQFAKFQNEVWLPVYFVVVLVIIFLAATIIDYVRRKYVDYYIFRLVEGKINDWFKKV